MPSSLVLLPSWDVELLSLPVWSDVAGESKVESWEPVLDAELEWDLTRLVPWDGATSLWPGENCLMRSGLDSSMVGTKPLGEVRA